ncbi:MAG: hypothetical protein AAF990_04550 [Bacteroidota bacterium]
MNKKNWYLIVGILTGIVFVGSLLESEPGSFLGSIWLFRFEWLIMTASFFMSYYSMRKAEKAPP